ncbi:MAG: aspartate-semialdehyde dehydrogenase [Lachnospiraceae bacterium]|nr:aspartate-semialdehyde dehydrogenase [Lachnospiraceae bacterium]
MKNLSLAVVGATGAVGEQLLKCIDERKIPFTELKLLASSRSAGKIINFQGRDYTVEETTIDSFKGVDAALFAGGPASVAFGRAAAEQGTVVIDNSSTFRYEPDVPLVVPEVNAYALDGHHNLIANPNCSTILLVTALYPLHKFSKVKRVIVSSYQACSGAGKEGMEELINQSRDVLDGKPAEPKAFKYQIAFNCIPQIDKWMEFDYTKEEMKFVWETHKIMGDETIGVTPVAAVRVPVIRSHCEAVYVETEEPISVEKARELYKECPWVVLQDDPANFLYPMPVTSTDTDFTYVGRIRPDLVNDHALNMWISFDQIRKGAATNAVQILEELIRRDLL